MHRAAREFVYLSITGSVLTATGSGRLDGMSPTGHRFTLSLGPSHTHQQTRFDAAATRGWRTASIRVTD
jgi:hypothetical protein